jgi:hypothetical protein
MSRYWPFAARQNLLLAVWLLALLAGFAWLQLHASTPERQAPAPREWPASSRLKLNADGCTLLVFIHPYCPCSRATLEELARIMTRCRGRLEAQVVLTLPGDERADWERLEYWTGAAAIPGVRPTADVDGREAQRFGARTSGQTLLFDQSGTLRFAGGVTASRGHAGDNAGEDAIVSWVLDGIADVVETPTFGCGLPLELAQGGPAPFIEE